VHKGQNGTTVIVKIHTEFMTDKMNSSARSRCIKTKKALRN